MSGTGPGTARTPTGSASRANGTHPPPVTGDPWQWQDPATMPPRPWLLGTTLLRGHTTLLGSPGGTGKTAWAVAAALAVITGRQDILSLHSFVQGPVWFITLEDDKAELNRRIAAAMMEHGIQAADIAGRLFLTDGLLKLVAYDPQQGRGMKLAEPTVSVEDAKDFIRQENILLTVIDPLVKAHSVSGSSNEDMDVLITLTNEIGRDTGCAMLLPCHFRKGGDLDTDGRDMFRGASALVDGTRIAQGMQGMTKKEGEEFGVLEEEVGRYVRITNLKANMTPKAAATDWLELVSHPLGNTGVDPAYPAGDHVQAIRSWLPPALFDGMDLAVMTAIFSRLGDPSVNFHEKAGGNRIGAGSVIMALARKTKEQAARILRLWIDSGTLVETPYKNKARQESIKLVPDPAKVAAILADLAARQPSP